MVEISDHDVLIATTSFDLDPFEEEKKIKRQETLQKKGDERLKQISISILGQPGVGKSALAIRFCKQDFLSYYSPTIEDEYRFQFKLDSKKM